MNMGELVCGSRKIFCILGMLARLAATHDSPDKASTLKVADPPIMGGSGVSVTCGMDNGRAAASQGCHVIWQSEPFRMKNRIETNKST